MERSPFLTDPRDEAKRHVSLAVESPIEAVRAFHIGAAQHAAEIATTSGLEFGSAGRSGTDVDDRAQRWTRRVLKVAFVCLAAAVLGMVAMAVALLRR